MTAAMMKANTDLCDLQPYCNFGRTVFGALLYSIAKALQDVTVVACACNSKDTASLTDSSFLLFLLKDVRLWQAKAKPVM